MPCYDDRDRYRDDPAEEVQRLRDRNHELTRLLCLACATLDQSQGDPPAEVTLWWREHQRMDVLRVADERRQTNLRVEQLEAERARINAEIDQLRRGQ